MWAEREGGTGGTNRGQGEERIQAIEVAFRGVGGESRHSAIQVKGRGRKRESGCHVQRTLQMVGRRPCVDRANCCV